MAIAIANVELTNSFDQWRITTNQMLKALREDVVLKEDLNSNGFNPFPELVQTTSLDSVEVEAEPISSSPIDTVQLLDDTKTKNFKAGQRVRIYGARLDGSSAAIIPAPIAPSASKSGFLGFTGGSTFSYRIAQFDYNTGKISQHTNAVEVTNVDHTNFNDVNNIAVVTTRTDTNYGILVYRNIAGALTTSGYSLIAVLGPKDLVGSQNTWVDYFDYDAVPWSRKNSRNEYTINSGLIHFPIQSSASPKLGWVDTEVVFVDTTLNRIKFKDMCFFEGSVIVSHDDTKAIQDAINFRFAQGAKSLELATKTYFVQGLVIPTNFAILGNGTKTTLRKLSWSSYSSDTGNKILESDGNINDFNLSNLVIDGNMQNQFLMGETVDPNANYAIDIQGNTSRYENIKLINVIGGGINASPRNNQISSSISVVSSFIQDGNLNDRFTYSPLDISSSSEVVVTSNIFKNFPGAVEASVVTTGSIVGNVIKNCGSGLVVFGSTNLVSSPNVLMGPANEFLPSADILNSVYDSVNIKLERDANYNSDNYTYQENGTPFNISPSNNRSVLYHRIDKLQKINNTESLYGDEILIAGQRPIQSVPGTNLANGEFRFTINQLNVNVLLNDYDYAILKAQNPNHVGLVYRSMVTEYVPSGNVTSTPSFVNIARPIAANTIGVNGAADVINMAGANTYFNLGDEVVYVVPTDNTAITGLTANTNYFVSFVNSTAIALSNRYNGANVNINETRVTAESHTLNKVNYTVFLNNVTNINNGTRVRFISHGGTPSLNDIVGTVYSYNSVTGQCDISYPIINITSSGTGGSITVENSFVLAKGRIL